MGKSFLCYLEFMNVLFWHVRLELTSAYANVPYHSLEQALLTWWHDWCDSVTSGTIERWSDIRWRRRAAWLTQNATDVQATLIWYALAWDIFSGGHKSTWALVREKWIWLGVPMWENNWMQNYSFNNTHENCISLIVIMNLLCICIMYHSIS